MARKSNPSSQTATDWQAIDAQISACHDLVDADGINCARRRRDRWTGALTILLLIALIALPCATFHPPPQQHANHPAPSRKPRDDPSPCPQPRG